jgi:hypothetical protein
MERITPLVEALNRFCAGNRAADGGASAAAAMIKVLSGVWQDIPAVTVIEGPGEEMDRDELALAVIRDVGELAGLMISEDDPARALGWARANLLVDLRQYLAVVCPDSRRDPGGPRREPS